MPEIVVLGTAVMYKVIYDGRGTLAGGRRYRDPQLIVSWRRIIADLFAAGEPLTDYFDRRVAPLPPPTVNDPT